MKFIYTFLALCSISAASHNISTSLGSYDNIITHQEVRNKRRQIANQLDAQKQQSLASLMCQTYKNYQQSLIPFIQKLRNKEVSKNGELVKFYENIPGVRRVAQSTGDINFEVFGIHLSVRNGRDNRGNILDMDLPNYIRDIQMYMNLMRNYIFVLDNAKSAFRTGMSKQKKETLYDAYVRANIKNIMARYLILCEDKRTCGMVKMAIKDKLEN